MDTPYIEFQAMEQRVIELCRTGAFSVSPHLPTLFAPRPAPRSPGHYGRVVRSFTLPGHHTPSESVPVPDAR